MAIEISAIWNVVNRLFLFKQFSEDEAKPRPTRSKSCLKTSFELGKSVIYIKLMVRPSSSLSSRLP